MRRAALYLAAAGVTLVSGGVAAGLAFRWALHAEAQDRSFHPPRSGNALALVNGLWFAPLMVWAPWRTLTVLLEPFEAGRVSFVWAGVVTIWSLAAYAFLAPPLVQHETRRLEPVPWARAWAVHLGCAWVTLAPACLFACTHDAIDRLVWECLLAAALLGQAAGAVLAVKVLVSGRARGLRPEPAWTGVGLVAAVSSCLPALVLLVVDVSSPYVPTTGRLERFCGGDVRQAEWFGAAFLVEAKPSETVWTVLLPSGEIMLGWGNGARFVVQRLSPTLRPLGSIAVRPPARFSESSWPHTRGMVSCWPRSNWAGDRVWLVLDGLTPRNGSLLTRLRFVFGDGGLGIGAVGALLLALLGVRVATARRLVRRLARAREGVDLFSGSAWREGRSVRFEGKDGESQELDLGRARSIGLGRFPSSPSSTFLVILGRLVRVDAGAYRATSRFDPRDRLVLFAGGRDRAAELVASILTFRCLLFVWFAFELGLACLMVRV